MIENVGNTLKGQVGVVWAAWSMSTSKCFSMQTLTDIKGFQ